MTIKARVARLEKKAEPEYLMFEDLLDYLDGDEIPDKEIEPGLAEWLDSLPEPNKRIVGELR